MCFNPNVEIDDDNVYMDSNDSYNRGVEYSYFQKKIVVLVIGSLVILVITKVVVLLVVIVVIVVIVIVVVVIVVSSKNVSKTNRIIKRWFMHL